MITFLEYLQEASYAGRGWAGKLSKINSLINWMDEKNILSPFESHEWDAIKDRYYRWYNDGERDGETNTAEYREYDLEQFIKKVLAKYRGKYDRADFRFDTAIAKLDDLIDFYGCQEKFYAISELIKKIKETLNTDAKEVKEIITNLEFAKKEFETEVKKVLNPYPSLIEGAIIRELKNSKLMNKKIESKVSAIREAVKALIDYCESIKEIYKKSKAVL